MSLPSFESLCLKDDDNCPSPTDLDSFGDEFDKDLESDGEHIKFNHGIILEVLV